VQAYDSPLVVTVVLADLHHVLPDANGDF